ncbi:MAG TPA: superoxide dismutase family protein [Spirillospora sp.]
MRPSVRTALAAAAAALAPLAVGQAPAAPAKAAPAPPDHHVFFIHGPARVHDDAYRGMLMGVAVVRQENRTSVRLHVSGFPESARGRTFGAHVHVNACGPRPEDAGPHYRNPDAEPGTPLREKEIWLDVTIGDDGHGRSHVDVPWRVARDAAGSIVVHAEPTEPRTGDAGARLACITVPF